MESLNSTDLSKKQAAIFYFAAVLFIIFSRGHFITDTIYNVDEAVCAVYGNVLMDGGVPSRDAVDNRPFLTHLLYGFINSFTSDISLFNLHTFLAGLVIAISFLVYRVAAYFHSRKAAVLAVVWFAVASFNYKSIDMLAFHIEWPMIFCITAGVLLLFRGLDTDHLPPVALSGAFCALAALSKQPALVDFGFFVLYLVFCARKKPASRRPYLFLAAFLAGFAGVFMMLFIYLIANDSLPNFWYYFWEYGLLYSSAVPLFDRVGIAYSNFFSKGSFFYDNAIPTLAVLSYLFSPTLRKTVGARADHGENRPQASFFLMGWFMAACIGSSLSGRGFGHYYIQVLPPLSVIAGMVFCRISGAAWEWSERLSAKGVPRVMPAVPFLGMFLMAMFIYPLWNVAVTPKGSHIKWSSFPWIIKPPAHDAHHYYDFSVTARPTFQKTVSYIKTASRPSDKIFVWGFLPEIYVKTGLRPASRFLYCHYLTGFMPLINEDPGIDTADKISPGAWDELMADLQKNKPRFIVDTTVGGWNSYGKYPVEKYDRLKKFLEAHYEVDRSFQDSGKPKLILYRRIDQRTPYELSDLPSVIGHWRCEDNAKDSSPKARKSILYGTLPAEGVKGQALEFDGRHDFIDLGKGFAAWPEGLTFACWAYPTAVKSWARFLELGNGAPEDNVILAREGTTNDLAFEVYRGETSAGRITAKNAIKLNEWQHFAVTLSPGGFATLFKNGAPIATGQTNSPAPVIRKRNYTGRSNWHQDEYYAGRLDEIFVFQRALTSAEIRALMEGSTG